MRTVQASRLTQAARLAIVPRALLASFFILIGFAPGRVRADDIRRVIPLPAELDDVEPAAGGRLLVMHLPKLERFAIFDTTAAKLVKYIPYGGDHLVFAATLHKLIVLNVKDKTLERLDLATGASELTVPWKAKSTPVSIAAGFASDGPVCVFADYQSGWSFLDPQTFEPVKFKREGVRDIDHGIVCIRAAADGSAFAAWQEGRQGFRVLSIEGSRCIYRLALESPNAELPTFDGLQILSDLGALQTSNVSLQTNYKSFQRTNTLIPTYDPAFYVGIYRGEHILND